MIIAESSGIRRKKTPDRPHQVFLEDSSEHVTHEAGKRITSPYPGLLLLLLLLRFHQHYPGSNVSEV